MVIPLDRAKAGHDSNPVHAFIDAKLNAEIGEGCRYQNKTAFEYVLQIVGVGFNIPVPEKLAHPGTKRLTCDETIISAALMGLTHEELRKFSGIVRDYYPPRADDTPHLAYDEVLRQVDDVIAHVHGAHRAVAPKAAKPQTTPKAQPRGEQVKLHFPQGKTGNQLLQYAFDNHLTFGHLLGEIGKATKASDADLAKSLHLSTDQYAKFRADDVRNGKLMEAMNGMAKILGADSDGEITAWRKFMLGIPRDIDQQSVVHFIDDEASRTEKSYGQRRVVELARFFKLLGDRHGFPTRSQLAQAAAAHAGAGGGEGMQLRQAMDNMAGPQENAILNPRNIPARERDPNHRTKIMDSSLAEMLSRFAFPNDEKRRTICLEFLTSEKYKTPPEIESEHKSAAMKNTRKKRGDDWGRRGKNGQGDFGRW